MAIDKTIFDKRLTKSAEIENASASAEDMEKINQYTIEPLTADDVFVFKMTVGDNRQNTDRNDMPFTAAAIRDMSEHYPGVTMLCDHNHSTSVQVGRIFDAQCVVDLDKTVENGEQLTACEVKAYILDIPKNADLIAEIKGGIKKEVSTSTVPKRLVCSICGTDNMQHYCEHYAGYEYNGEICKMIIDGVSECYELSFVAVPAQPEAGTHKSVDEIDNAKRESQEVEQAVAVKTKIIDSFIFQNKEMI